MPCLDALPVPLFENEAKKVSSGKAAVKMAAPKAEPVAAVAEGTSVAPRQRPKGAHNLPPALSGPNRRPAVSQSPNPVDSGVPSFQVKSYSKIFGQKS